MSEQVKHPGHYLRFGVEVKDIIAWVLDSPENEHLTQYEAYCMGNEIKYRLRAGFKGAYEQDMEKAMQYNLMRERSPLRADEDVDAEGILYVDIVEERDWFFKGFKPQGA